MYITSQSNMEKMLIYWLKMRRQKSARSHTSVAVAPQIRQQGSRVVSYHQEQMKNTRMMTLIAAEMTDSKAQLSSFQLKARHIFFSDRCQTLSVPVYKHSENRD